MLLRFTKMHGLGNDFIVFDAPSPADLPTPQQLRAMADRHTGIGFDQALVLSPARREGTDVYYRIFNADGGEVEQCGNGARAVATLLRLRGRSATELLNMDSPGGVVRARLEPDGLVSVDMGEPDFSPASLPFLADQLADTYTLDIDGQRVEFAIVSVGNPHAVITVASVADAAVSQLGPAIERHPRFPKRVNVGFMQIDSPASIRLRVFERGVGETLACGTGACAAVAVGCKAGRLASHVEVHAPGGRLEVTWEGPGHPVWLKGPAAASFHGTIEI